MVDTEGKEIEGKVSETEFKQGITEPPPEPEPTPPTAEEQLATLRTEMEALRTKHEQADKGLRSAQATLTQKDRLIKDREAQATRLDSLEDSIQILAGVVAKGGNIDPEDANEYKKSFAAIKEQRDRDKKESALKLKEDEYMQKAIAIHTEAEGVFGDDTDKLHTIRNLIRAGDFDLAEKQIAKAKEKPVDKEPTDDKVVSDLKKEVEKLKREISGSADSETGLPTGSSANVAEIRKRFRETPDDPKVRKAYLDWKNQGE